MTIVYELPTAQLDKGQRAFRVTGGVVSLDLTRAAREEIDDLIHKAVRLSNRLDDTLCDDADNVVSFDNWRLRQVTEPGTD